MTEARLASGRGYTPDDFTPPPEAAPYEVTRTRATMMAQAEQQIAKISALDQQMAQKDAEADSTQASIDKLEAGLPFLEETAAVRQKAMNIEFGNRIAHLDAQLKLSEQRQNRSTIVREANMRWTYHQDLSDVPGWQDEDDNPIRFYVKNESGVRIAYFGRGKEAYYFIYSDRDLLFRFSASRSPGQGRNFPPDKIPLGPECSIYIQTAFPKLDELGAREVVSNIEAMLIGGELLSQIPYPYDGPQIERVVFLPASLRALNLPMGSSHG